MLKDRQITAVAARLNELVARGDGPLVASLDLSLERLDPEFRAVLPRLGVFQGGAFENDLIKVTEITAGQWTELRPVLVAAGLIYRESVPGEQSSWLRFHPTLAPVMWARLGAEERVWLGERFREEQFKHAKRLYEEDRKDFRGTRAVARLALPNLLAAVRQALDARAPYAVAFVECVNWFLNFFGLSHDHADLIHRMPTLAGETGSRDWFLSSSAEGDDLLNAGRLAEAAQVFAQVLAGLSEQPSYWRCITLHLLARCHQLQRQSAKAADLFREAIAEAGTLEQSDHVRRELGGLQTELADVLTAQGDYAGARTTYETAIEIANEVSDERGAAVARFNLGILAHKQGDLDEAKRLFQVTLVTFQRSDYAEPKGEANAWHHLGMVYAEEEQWERAEHAYGKSAQLEERIGNKSGVAAFWDQIAQMTKARGRPAEAEGWYLKALKARREANDPGSVAVTLNNLANLLTVLPGRLDDARDLAEDALVLCKTLDPAAALIWKTYDILARIAGQQGDTQTAARYRRAGQASYAAFPGSRQSLRRFGRLIAAVVETVARPAGRADLEQALEPAIEQGGGDLVAAIRRILNGERDPEALAEPLNYEDALIVQTILTALRDPDSISDLLE